MILYTVSVVRRSSLLEALYCSLVVDNVQDTDFTGADDLGPPGEVTGFETEGAELEVSSAGPNGGDVFGSNIGHGCWATIVELALLGELTTASSCLATLISSGTSDSLLRLDSSLSRPLNVSSFLEGLQLRLTKSLLWLRGAKRHRFP
jgi:hypothetical protein